MLAFSLHVFLAPFHSQSASIPSADATVTDNSSPVPSSVRPSPHLISFSICNSAAARADSTTNVGAALFYGPQKGHTFPSVNSFFAYFFLFRPLNGLCCDCSDFI